MHALIADICKTAGKVVCEHYFATWGACRADFEQENIQNSHLMLRNFKHWMCWQLALGHPSIGGWSGSSVKSQIFNFRIQDLKIRDQRDRSWPGHPSLPRWGKNAFVDVNPAGCRLSILHIFLKDFIDQTRSLGPTRNSSLTPFGPLDFILHTLQAHRPCDPHIYCFQDDWNLI